jgi:hypothetical protein
MHKNYVGRQDMGLDAGNGTAALILSYSWLGSMLPKTSVRAFAIPSLLSCTTCTIEILEEALRLPALPPLQQRQSSYHGSSHTHEMKYCDTNQSLRL